jgi:hypothetical protein
MGQDPCQRTAQESITGMSTDVAGNVYLAGNVKNGTVDVDPGPGVVNITGSANGQIFVMKLDVSGNFAWVKTPTSHAKQSVNALCVDMQGNVYTTGNYTGTEDFDPGNTIVNLVSNGGYDMFILKLDAAGNFVWAKSIGGTNADEGRGITTNEQGNVFVTGIYRMDVDFDPGPGVSLLTGVSSYRMFALKLDAAGQFIWAKRTGDIGFPFGIVCDAQQHVLTYGVFKDSSNFDPGASNTTLTAPGKYASFIVRLDSMGNFNWVKKIGDDRALASGIAGVQTDKAGNIYATGGFTDSADFDPGPAIFRLKCFFPGGGDNMFLVKLDAAGNLVWALQPEGGHSWAGGLAIDAGFNIYTGGYIGAASVDFDMGPGVFNITTTGIAAFVCKMGQGTLGIDRPGSTYNSPVVIYPNPTSGIFTLSIAPPSKDATIEIYNTLGSLVYKQSNLKEINSIDLTNSASGVYFVRLIEHGETVATRRLLKQ